MRLMSTTRLHLRTRPYLKVLALMFATGLVLLVVDRVIQTDPFTCDKGAIIVQQGDTLYSLSHANCLGDVSRAVDILVDTYGSTISVGQQITLPIDK